MNKQPKLIDADKVIQDVERRMNELLQDRSDDYDRFPVINALENFLGRLKSEMYDPDTPAVPTIKPGDTAVHSDLGKVRVVSDPMVSVLKDKDEYEVYLSDLEVSHDRG